MEKLASGQAIVRLIVLHFSVLKDPRVARTRKYELSHLLVMALCASLSGADGFKAIALHVKNRRRLFSRWLGVELERTPSADTFRRLFGALLPSQFEACMRRFVGALSEQLGGEVVAVDGKEVVRGVLGASRRPLHMLHVWATQQRLVLAQEAVEGAPGEPVAAPEVLRSLNLKGATVTGDANLCTEDVAAACVDGKADYVLCLKGNRGTLHSFAASLGVLLAWQGMLPQGKQRHMRPEGKWAHGRYEVREAWALSPRAWPVDWPGLRTLILVRRTRALLGGGHQEEWHVYISSLPPDASRLARAIRSHWDVENGLHWCLDVQMGESQRRVRHEAAAQNLARLHRLSLSMLQREKSERLGIALKRQNAATNARYLRKVLSAGIP
jgi:predicted transposase YbfD/YdcC